MKSCNIDIHDIIKKLIQVKIPEVQAEAMAQSIANAVKDMPSHEYIEIKFEKVSLTLEKSIHKLKADLLAWYIGVGLVQMTALIISILLMLHEKS